MGACAGRVPRLVRRRRTGRYRRRGSGDAPHAARSSWWRTRSSSRRASMADVRRTSFSIPVRKRRVLSRETASARAGSPGHVHVERRRRRGGASRPATRAGQVTRFRHAAGAQSAGADQEPGAPRNPEARRRVVLAAVDRHVDAHRLQGAAAHDRPPASADHAGCQPADANQSSGDGPRSPQLDAPGVLRGRHGW